MTVAISRIKTLANIKSGISDKSGRFSFMEDYVFESSAKIYVLLLALNIYYDACCWFFLVFFFNKYFLH